MAQNTPLYKAGLVDRYVLGWDLCYQRYPGSPVEKEAWNHMKWNTEKRKIKDLHENPKNPRKLSKHQAEHLQRSIEKFGLCEPIVINPDGSIIGGHQRIRTLKKMGHKEVDVYVPERALDDKEIDELTVRLNKNTGDWDFDILANQWELSDLLNWGFSEQDFQIDVDVLQGTEPEESGENKEQRKCTMIITFMSPDHLQEAENKIAVIVDAYPGATHKVKIS